MKLVELLAKELSEWPKNVVVYFQWGNGEVFATSKGVPTEYKGSMWYVVGPDIEMAYDAPMYDKMLDLSDDHDTATVNKEQWQAERDRQKGGEWKRARGVKPKYETETPQRMEVRHRDGDITKGWTSQSWNWSHNDGCPSADIMAWRIISQPQAEEVEVIPVHMMLGYGSNEEMVSQIGEVSPFEQVANELKWGQIDGPIKWRDTVNELDAYIEEFTRERDALINRLALEGFALIPAMTPVMGVADIDFSDWRNWKDGDIVEVVFENDADLTIGTRCVVASIERPDYIYGMPVSVYDAQADDGSFFWPEDITEEGRLVFKFVSRP